MWLFVVDFVYAHSCVGVDNAKSVTKTIKVWHHSVVAKWLYNIKKIRCCRCVRVCIYSDIKIYGTTNRKNFIHGSFLFSVSFFHSSVPFENSFPYRISFEKHHYFFFILIKLFVASIAFRYIYIFSAIYSFLVCKFFVRFWFSNGIK